MDNCGSYFQKSWFWAPSSHTLQKWLKCQGTVMIDHSFPFSVSFFKHKCNCKMFVITIITPTFNVNGNWYSYQRVIAKWDSLKSTIINLCNNHSTNIISSGSCLMICIHPISKNTAKHRQFVLRNPSLIIIPSYQKNITSCCIKSHIRHIVLYCSCRAYT